ncbi:MAG: protein kinase [Bryobacteraceae bacterium]
MASRRTTLEPDSWQRVKELLGRVIEATPEERSRLLSSDANDPTVIQEVRRLWDEYQRAGAFLDRPDNDQTQLRAGELVAGRFKVIRLIGQGGMGEVYEVHDELLKVRLALKTIKLDLASHPDVLERFYQEVQTARKVTHPGVCRIFDFMHCRAPNSDREILLFTMELLQGEDLGARLERNGVLPSDLAFTVSRDLCNALAAAHDVGVIHRDLKPANVILVNRGPRVAPVITDFGLAKEFAAAVGRSGLTSHRAIGTPHYMAPEQWMGAPTTPATDVFALGSVMYECVTGKRPFSSESGALPRWIEDPTPPSRMAGDVDKNFEKVILRCLAIRPEDRFQNAHEVNAALAQSPPAPKRPRALLARTHGLFTRKVVTSSIIFVVLLLLVGAALYLRYTGSRAAVPAGSVVFLAGVENATHDPELDGVTEVLRGQIAQSGHFNLLDSGRIRVALERMRKPLAPEQLDSRTAREIAMREGASLVLFGTVYKLGDDYRLQLLLERTGKDPASAAKHWTGEWDVRSKSALFDAIHEGSDWVRREVGETQQEIATSDLPAELTTTDSWEALSYFSEAEKLKRMGRVDEAVDVLREALEKDPRFALARMRLGDFLFSLKRTQEGYAEWEKAIADLKSERLSDRESLRIRGQYALESGDYARAEEVFRVYQLHFPNDNTPWLYETTALRMLGRVEEAIAELKSAEIKDPRDFRIPAHVAMDYIILGQLGDAREYILKLRKLDQPDLGGYLEANVDHLAGKDQLAQALYEGLRQSSQSEWQSASYAAEACLFAEQGNYQRALSVLDQGIAADLSSGRSEEAAEKRVAKAFLYWRMGDRDKCRSECFEVLDVDSDISRLTRAGSLLARTGDLKEAGHVLTRLTPVQFGPVAEIARLRLIGEIELGDGHFRRALANMQKAAALDSHIAEKEYLVRALIASNEEEDASHLLEKTIDHPGRIWFEPEYHPPGIVSELSTELKKIQSPAAQKK